MSVQAATWVGVELGGGRYRVVEQLGEGGMGVVYRAQDSRLRTDVVIKAPLRKFIHNEDIVKRFQREVYSLVQLSHPHIVKIIDVGNHDGLPYAVLHFLSGGSLKDRQRRGADGQALPLPVSSLSEWMLPVAQALDFIHQQNFIHRDVKPPNILFDAHGNVYLSDFGIAKAMASVVHNATLGQTQQGQLFGTPGYMAPELIEGLACDGRTDQYALALTAYEMLAGRGPFHGVPLGAVMLQQRQHKFDMLHQIRPDVPLWMSEALHKAVSYDPSDRFPTCVALAQAVVQPLAKGTSSSDTVRLPCPTCQKALKVPGVARGRRVTCPYCKTTSTVAPNLASLSAMPFLPAQALPVALPAPPAIPVARLPSASDYETANPAPHAPTEPGALPMASFAPPEAKHGKLTLVLALIMLVGVAVGVMALAGVFSSKSSPTGIDDGLVTRDDVITGKMTIEFKSRVKKGEKDVYQIEGIRVRADSRYDVLYSGKIERWRERPLRPDEDPNDPKPDRMKLEIQVRKQELGADGQPNASKIVPIGSLAGVVHIDENDVFHFENVRWELVACRGKMQGKTGENKKHEARTLIFDVGDEQLEKTLEGKFDPMEFQQLWIPGEQQLGLTPVLLNGQLTYIYETGSYLASNLTFSDGDKIDRVQGLIQWTKDPTNYTKGKKAGDTVQRGQSEYSFNLSFNPRQASKKSARKVTEETDLVVRDGNQPKLTGIITYYDDGKLKEDLSIRPLRSEIVFNLHANRLTPTQIHNFLKMWLLMSGPVNDE